MQPNVDTQSLFQMVCGSRSWSVPLRINAHCWMDSSLEKINLRQKEAPSRPTTVLHWRSRCRFESCPDHHYFLKPTSANCPLLHPNCFSLSGDVLKLANFVTIQTAIFPRRCWKFPEIHS